MASLLVVSLLLLAFCSSSIATCQGVLFSSLKQTLILTASPTQGQVLKAGEDKITLRWSYNTSFLEGTNSSYKTLKFKLCYAPISQKDRGWRKTNDDLKKDKTCQHKIVEQPYNKDSSKMTHTWTVEKYVPSATYFVRVYAFDSAGNEAAYGQTNHLFDVKAISGRHATLDICSVCFSAFSLISLGVFYYLEKRKSN